MAIDVTAADFEQQVLQRSFEVPVVVDFWAEWCGPCRMLGPVLEKLEAEDDGAWVLAKLDTDANQDLAAGFQIQGIPAVKAFVNGQVVDEFVGALPAPTIRMWLERFVPSEADEKVAEAEQLVSAGDPAGAVERLEQALGLRADHARALLALAELQPERTEELLKRLPPKLDPQLLARKSRLQLQAETTGSSEEELRAALAADPAALETRWALAHVLEAREAHEEALELLLSIVARDRGFRDDGARKAMIRIFEVLGRSELTDRWRSKLAMELYK